MAASATGDGPVIIKKYANRRLYNTESSSYITLEHLAEMVRQKRDFQVVDAKTGEDITRSVLTQIIVEEESRGSTMLPINFLRQLISMYGDSMQAVVPQFLEQSLEAFQRNQSQFRDAMAGAFTGNPLAEMAKRNMELFTASAAGKKPGPEAHPQNQSPRQETGQTDPDTKAELAELKAQLAALQTKLEKLSG